MAPPGAAQLAYPALLGYSPPHGLRCTAACRAKEPKRCA